MYCSNAIRSYSTINKLETSQVLKVLKDQNWVIVDTRSNDAFNGWKLEGASRGGRIPGSVDFSANWLRVDSKEKQALLKNVLKTKSIIREKQILLYDCNGIDAQVVADYLKANGVDRISFYDMKQWLDNQTLPLEKYSNYHLIVPPCIVKAIIDGERPESFENANEIKIVEASCGLEAASYAKGHIPTAFHIDTNDFEPPEGKWMLADDAHLVDFASKYGFKKKDTVIVTSKEQLAAYRTAIVLRYIGIKDVRVLNGSLRAWKMAGYDLELASVIVSKGLFDGDVPGNQMIIDCLEEVKKKLKTPETFTLVDSRSWEEYTGAISGYSGHTTKGRIPGAKFGDSGRADVYSVDNFRNIDGTMRNANEFMALWKANGIDLTKHLSFMCGSGWRASEICTYANVAGLENISIFSDGWIGWSSDSNNPICRRPFRGLVKMPC